jgi:histidinol phosphatase-like enzyme
VDTGVCSHEAGPPACWCRKPIPGSVLAFAFRRDVDLAKSIVIGNSAADRTMAERIGSRLTPADAFPG